MISHKHKLIFLHVPKNAGCSIERTIGCEEELKYTYKYKNNEKPYLINKQHAIPIEIKEEYGKNIWNEYIKIAVVRNPWDRFVSLYFHFKRIKLLSEKITFEKFVNIFDANKQNILQQKHINMGLPQTTWTTKEIDIILSFENLAEEFSLIATDLGFNKNLKWINKTDHSEYTSYYDENTKQIIRNIYYDDIEKFSYRFRR